MDRERPYLILQGKSGNRYEVNMKDARPMGCLQRIEHVLLHLHERSAKLKQQVDNVRKQCEAAEAGIRKGNQYDTGVTELMLRLSEIDEELEERAACE